MSKCEYCKQSIQAQDKCPNCGTTVYSAMGKVIYGRTANDMSFCSITVTDKYIILQRMSKGEVNAKRYSAAGGLLGVFIAEVATTKERESGYYPLSNIEKGIFPYLATGIKKKNAIKLINKDGSDFIIIVDQPGFVDSVWKALKKTVEAIQQRIPMMEDGSNKNYGSVICAKPCVTVENFDKIKPQNMPDTNANSVDTEPKTKPQSTTKVKPAQVSRPVIITPPPTAEAEEITCKLCGSKTPAESKFCNKCGGKIEIVVTEEKKCAQCGTVIGENVKFCHICGSKVAEEKVELNQEEKCNNCGATVSAGKKFCSQCGQKIVPIKPRQTNCIRCGEPLEENDKFCSGCGYQVK